MHYPHAPHRSDHFTVLRDGEWKVVYHYFPSAVSENSHYQLFNLKDDPFEQRNLAATRPEVLRRTMQVLVAELDRHQALYPVEQGSRQPARPKLP
jgi:arylsulfatase A-like enzyme